MVFLSYGNAFLPPFYLSVMWMSYTEVVLLGSGGGHRHRRSADAEVLAPAPSI